MSNVIVSSLNFNRLRSNSCCCKKLFFIETCIFFMFHDEVKLGPFLQKTNTFIVQLVNNGIRQLKSIQVNINNILV